MNKLFDYQKAELDKMKKKNENLENMVFQLQRQLAIKSQELTNLHEEQEIKKEKSKTEPEVDV